ncbi:MAG: exopolygalacturonase [Clostridia bacterium]|nr:exopolygalacturonase [Clostridia bacterium]
MILKEKNNKTKETFPDGTIIDEWFYDYKTPCIEDFSRYTITEYGVKDDGNVYTERLQDLIDRVSENGGGVLVVPEGTFYTGALFFKQGVGLYIEKGGILKGSDDISDYPVMQTRIEGQNCLYYPALINSVGTDGFAVFGDGIIDGNGLRAWKAFWKRKEWNPECTNKDEQRPRLLFLSGCKNALISGVSLRNSPFWTCHIYKCDHIKFIGCNIFAPHEPLPAPSSDAIDIDVCSDVLIKNCSIENNDDGVVLKGGKGVWADKDPSNGVNERIIVEDCSYGYSFSVLTCGSESVHNRNVLVRRISVNGVLVLAHFKMRTDTPQRYEYISIKDVNGDIAGSFININPWHQFHDFSGRENMPRSIVENITIKDCECSCDCFFFVNRDEKRYDLKNFYFDNLKIRANKRGNDMDVVENIKIKDLFLEIL